MPRKLRTVFRGVASGCGRSPEALIYAYATRSEQKWLFDMHIINPGEPPSFGWDVPHMYVPMSAIFIAVYTDCKKFLGISDQRG